MMDSNMYGEHNNLTILSDRLEDSLKYVVVDNDVKKADAVEVTIKYQRKN